jgi:hypothetical protein
MRSALILVFAVACGGPSQRQLAETPSATAPPRPVEAPPASTSDKDRERSIQQFDDMERTQRAYQEAEQENASTPPPAPRPGQAPPPKKKGPAEQAPKP